jgi:hypothetical protein
MVSAKLFLLDFGSFSKLFFWLGKLNKRLNFNYDLFGWVYEEWNCYVENLNEALYLLEVLELSSRSSIFRDSSFRLF